jgi:adenosine deaminase
VIYLEVRSTPKRLLVQHQPDNSNNNVATKRDYVDTVLSVLHEFQQQDEDRYQREIKEYNNHHNSKEQQQLPRLPMTCWLIISVDWSQSVQEATEHIQLAIDLYTTTNNNMVVGVDLGGNTTKHDFGMFQHLFQQARSAGLNVTLHCAELTIKDDPNNHHDDNRRRYKEAAAMLHFQPDRLGHAVLLPPSLQALLKQLQIPVETCPTSKVTTTSINSNSTTTVLSWRNHHADLKDWLEQGHPLAICTNDPAIFDTTATQELCLVLDAFFGIHDKHQQAATKLVLQSMNYAFCDPTTKRLVQERMHERIQTWIL